MNESPKTPAGAMASSPRKPNPPDLVPPVAEKKTLTALEQLELLRRNLAAIREWYKSANTSGHEVGNITMREVIFADLAMALEMSIKGEIWKAPPNPPA